METLERLALLALTLLPCGQLPAQETPKSITISVHNGRTGDTLKDAPLLIFFGLSPKDAGFHKGEAELHTNSSGDATLPLDNAQLVYLQLFVALHTNFYDQRTFCVEEIVRQGISSPNHCGKASPPNAAGKLIIYTRPPTLRERMAW